MIHNVVLLMQFINTKVMLCDAYVYSYNFQCLTRSSSYCHAHYCQYSVFFNKFVHLFAKDLLKLKLTAIVFMQ